MDRFPIETQTAISANHATETSVNFAIPDFSSPNV
jgi:hypothetical protein